MRATATFAVELLAVWTCISILSILSFICATATIVAVVIIIVVVVIIVVSGRFSATIPFVIEGRFSLITIVTTRLFRVSFPRRKCRRRRAASSVSEVSFRKEKEIRVNEFS